MRPAVAGAILGWLLLGTWCMPARGDGGTIRLSVKKDGFLITVFSAPEPLRAGPVDISVLVQDGLTGDPAPEVRVTMRLTLPGQPVLEYPATREAATNKLLHAAQFELPAQGRWELEVRVEGSGGSTVVGGELEAGPPLPRWRELWPWVGWPVLCVALFGIHLFLVRRRTGKAAHCVAPGSSTPSHDLSSP